MFCSNCGNQVPDGQAFCSNCGANVAQAQPQQPQQPMYQQPQQPQQPYYQQPQQPTYQQPMYQQPQQAYGQPAPMANIDWYKIMSYFAMFAVALFSAITAIVTFTGTIYTEDEFEYAELMYRQFDGLQAVDIIHAIALLGLAAYGVYAWSRFYGRYADAPKHVSYVYLIATVLEAVYMILTLILVDSDGVDELVPFVLFILLQLTNAAMFAINKFYYFKNYGHQFTRR